ncbi:hypothetical protein [Chitinophaga eiseniae]|uniref:hypothetical protein n=1 Tax=Chitinophaga eiseniae TaxID=634771 RepID=UPI0013563B72|nr:hypothetical protein [Chitinophaga eiseniae]
MNFRKLASKIARSYNSIFTGNYEDYEDHEDHCRTARHDIEKPDTSHPVADR